eukprot:1925867-Alexandrium_andersonii.AAC.1
MTTVSTQLWRDSSPETQKEIGSLQPSCMRAGLHDCCLKPPAPKLGPSAERIRLSERWWREHALHAASAGQEL